MIAIDIMGGDYAPQASLEGALDAARDNIPVLLSGPKDTIISKLDSLDPSWMEFPIKILDAQDIIAMDDEPVRAALKKTESSLVKAVKSVQQGDADAIISAGNSGALMAAATLHLGKLEGVERPAIVGFLPGLAGGVLCLDLGANIDCKPSHLVKFAHMGSSHLQIIRNMERPKVGLLANGEEETKGSALVKEAHKLLKDSDLNFIGNVEPSDIVKNNVDVVVCDGFTGNILLKTLESTIKMTIAMLKQAGGEEYINGIVQKTAIISQGGAPLLGVNGTVIVAHGCSDKIAIKNAIKNAWEVVLSRKEACGS